MRVCEQARGSTDHRCRGAAHEVSLAADLQPGTHGEEGRAGCPQVAGGLAAILIHDPRLLVSGLTECYDQFLQFFQVRQVGV